MARKLVLLHMHHPRLYAFLNALVNIFVKGLPFTFYFLKDDSLWKRYGENSIQEVINGTINVIFFFMTFLMGMAAYLLLLGIWQLIKLFVCDYKRVNIYVHILGIIIRLGRKKILKSGDREAIDALYFHEECAENRRERIRRGKGYAAEQRRERDEYDLQNAREEYARQKSYADESRASAEEHYKKAREGGGWLTSASDEAKYGKSDMEAAQGYDEQAAYEKQRIAYLERRLSK